MICFAVIAPHPPLLLPTVGSEKDRKKVQETIEALESLGDKLKKVKPDALVISSPHEDWGFEVPLYFLARNFKGEIKKFLTDFGSPAEHFAEGKIFWERLDKNRRYAFIASGDLSHCLLKEGPYGFNPDGPKFDRVFQNQLVKKNIGGILDLDETYPEAGECGLRSFSFLLGNLEASKTNWQAKILSYEGSFGVGYLVAQLA